MTQFKKNVVTGLGEIGKPILQLLSKQTIAVGYDINKKLMDRKKFEKYTENKTSILHICIPYTKLFFSNVILLNKKFHPEIIVIHSTVSPYTTKQLQDKLSIPIIYSAIRGVHKRMLYDLKRYTKFFSIYSKNQKSNLAAKSYSKLMSKCGVKTKRMSNPLTLELAKIVCDTSYLGWLVNYAQISSMIAKEYRVDYDEMWLFADEIQKYIGNRPKMYPGFIGGHCVLPNLELIHNQTLDLIKTMNDEFGKKIRKHKK